MQLHTGWGEDKAQLADKIARDIEKFELLQMDFEILRHWYSGEIGYAHLAYFSRLRFAAPAKASPTPGYLSTRARTSSSAGISVRGAGS